MRYHWGLGVGHYHIHQGASTTPENSQDESPITNLHGVEEDQPEDDLQTINNVPVRHRAGGSNDTDDSEVTDSDDGELGLEDRQQEGWEDVESEPEDWDAENRDGEAEPEDEDHTGM